MGTAKSIWFGVLGAADTAPVADENESEEEKLESISPINCVTYVALCMCASSI